ncbi:hypothetical protein ABN306_01595 [Providencia huaxiensis]|uniref:Uncharacterized protein n=1 Tax=Providencia huaxiensis TaxID=2027290 RepID=A0ABU2IYL7_9GAMM|nr:MULTISPECIES: hypothetical protein [Providencia]MCD2528584.1 hypothetical protein [Providencia huaxiensis]MCG9537256.1 hypothetical protein [Providencia huaxiensis]MDI7239590.1 hypothetical protein [Providencia huaxiensis]MDT0134162.1 hypothetical protein [Providencia huaxiensis]MDT1980568.1 hypothetical protein [Providencia huaxiensis]
MTLNYSPKPDLVKMAKSSVEDYLSFPESASFRNVKYNFIRQTTDKGELGYVCGEVFRIKNARLEGYKKFIMKAYSDKQGKVSLSIPMVEGDYDLMPKEMVDSLWTRYCF